MVWYRPRGRRAEKWDGSVIWERRRFLEIGEMWKLRLCVECGGALQGDLCLGSVSLLIQSAVSVLAGHVGRKSAHLKLREQKDGNANFGWSQE